MKQFNKFVSDQLGINTEVNNVLIQTLPPFMYTLIHNPKYSGDDDFMQGLILAPALLSTGLINCEIIKKEKYLSIETHMRLTVEYDHKLEKILGIIMSGLADPRTGLPTFHGSPLPHTIENETFQVDMSYPVINSDMLETTHHAYFNMMIRSVDIHHDTTDDQKMITVLFQCGKIHKVPN